MQPGAKGYLGSKGQAGIAPAIVSQMPPHDTYIETHFGTGVVMRLKPPAPRNIAIEIDPLTLAEFPPPAFAEAHQADCVGFLEQFDWDGAGRVLVYADPPYVGATRTSAHRYRFEYTDRDHRRLIARLRALAARGVAIIISGYPSKLYDELLGDWRTIEMQAMTRGGVRTEKLWMSFDAGPVHWASFAGKDFTDRQRIKRKAATWAARYRAMPPAERLAVLAAIMAEETPDSRRVVAHATETPSHGAPE